MQYISDNIAHIRNMKFVAITYQGDLQSNITY